MSKGNIEKTTLSHSISKMCNELVNCAMKQNKICEAYSRAHGWNEICWERQDNFEK